MPVPAACLRPLFGLYLGALLLLLLPAAPLQAAPQDPCAGLEAEGNYRNQAEHADGRYRLRRDGTRVLATLTTVRSPVQHWVREVPDPLFTIPEAFRPPRPVLLTAEGMAVRPDGTPDPALPEPRRFGLRVDPDGAVHYADDTRVEGTGYLAYTLHTVWDAATATLDPCPGLETGGAYLNRAEHEGGRYRLRRDGTRVTATLTVDRSPVQHWAREVPQPLFTVPEPFRPPYSVLRTAEGTPVLADGTPDPDHPEPRRFLLRVDPDGAVHYADDARVEGVGYLAYSLDTVWGTTPAANDRAVLEILDRHWFRKTVLSAWPPPEQGVMVALDADGRVTVLDTASYHLNGSLLPELGQLHRLEHLDLSGDARDNFHTKGIANRRLLWNGRLSDEVTETDIAWVLEQFSTFPLIGAIPPELGQLARLRHLDLSSNWLWGPLPDIGHLASLEYLDLGDNLLSGSLPSEWSQLARLEHLSLSGNQLTGSLPSEWSQLARLEHLSLSGNQLTGSLPSEWSQLARLERLSLSHNGLTGPLPPAWGQLVHLELLSLSGNQLTGSLPSEWSQLARLERLSLSHNGLTGPLPPEWGRLDSLQELNLSFNQLTGPLPPAWGQLDSLQRFDLFDNQLTGSLPPEWGQLDSLQSLRLAGNRLTGSLPPAWGQLDSLEQLFLENNQLSGPLPPAWGQLDSLQRFDLFDNQLTGSLPPEWGQLDSLRELSLSGNRLTGSLPPEWSQLDSLWELSLSGNRLTGSLPPEWDQLDSLWRLKLTDNRLTGPLPPEWGQLTSLQELFLSDNQLTGSLPPEWGQLVRLRELSLSGNRLTGSLPPEWGQLVRLRRLFLNHNQLTGSLPPEWSRMRSLGLLDTSSNQLTGCLHRNDFPKPKYIHIQTDLPDCPSGAQGH